MDSRGWGGRGYGAVFCDDCVAQWFDRGADQERTCPLCRAVVKSQGLKSTYGDGTTGLLLQIF